MKPIIGIISCGFIENKQFVSNDYIQSIRYSSGIPFIIPLVRSDRILADYIKFCDGFLFCGGNDITPLLFRQEPLNGNGKTNITLDLFQIRLMKQILKTDKPIFAICRGMQVLNVACGGTIYQDLSLYPGKTLNHMQQSFSREEISHKITVTPGTLLHKSIGTLLYVNSFHHQTVKDTGDRICPCAIAPDHTIEAIEIPDRPFTLGVQWHPECMYRTSEKTRTLFQTFTHAAYLYSK